VIWSVAVREHGCLVSHLIARLGHDGANLLRRARQRAAIDNRGSWTAEIALPERLDGGGLDGRAGVSGRK
jgi:hypothetical protein